jgi:nucleotidyltransferase/DNA polymerase involved in DNA repair
MILHLDGDSFFASCELLRRRDLLGTPMVVGEERGIATAMNQEAKALGVIRGMPVFQIRAVFGKQVTVVPSHFDLYEHISNACYHILTKYSLIIERYSIDECFVDISHVPLADVYATVAALQAELKASLGVTYSCGIARTKALAKLGSKHKKPFGITHVTEAMESTFLEATPLSAVWGIGRALEPKLLQRGIRSARAFRDASRMQLKGIDMKGVLELQDELRGNNRFTITSVRKSQKSVESTRSFGSYSKERSFVLSELSKNIEVVSERLVDLGVVGSSARIFLKTALGRSYAQCELPHHTQDARIIFRSVQAAFKSLWIANTAYKATRISINDCKPIGEIQNSLFEQNETYPDTHNSLTETITKLKSAHGSSIIMLGSSLQSSAYRKGRKEARDVLDPYLYGLPLPYLGEVV